MFEQGARIAPLLIAISLVSGLTSCAKIPAGRMAIDDVTVRGTSKFDDWEVAEKLATAPSPKLLGLFQGVVYDYEIFDRFALQRDLARVERFYRARGYYDAHARAGRYVSNGSKHVRVEFLVDEGVPVVNDAPKLEGLDTVPPSVADAVRVAVTTKLKPGKPFDEDDFKAAETDAKRALSTNGYAYATVARDVFIDLVHHTASSVFVVAPDKPAIFGKVTIEGLADAAGRLSRIPEEPLRRAIDIKEGDRFSIAAIEAATQALLDLEVFSSVEIVPDLPAEPPPSRIVPLTVRVEPSKLRQVRLGGGLEFDQLKTDLHLLIGWEDHNFLGGLRDLTINFKPGAVLYPLRLDNLVAPSQVLPEGKLQVQLKQPGFLEARTHGFVRQETNVYPLLVKANPGANEPVVGYLEFRAAAGVDRVFGKLFASIGYNAQIEQPFAYVGTLDPDLGLIVISYPEVTMQLDFRDDRIHPHKGIYLGGNAQVAGGPFFGAATDLKVQGEIRTYVPVARKITFATRFLIGSLYPVNYGDVVEYHLSEPTTPANRSARVRDIETVFFRGFTSGGSSSNRGFPIRGISPHGVVPFLNPATAAQQVRIHCADPADPLFNPANCSIPIGGFSIWELSNELRFSVKGPFSAATFCDMSDVSPQPGLFRLDHLHLSCGMGARYETPVGPIRLDIGYRIQPAQVLGFKNEDAVFEAFPAEGKQPKLGNLLPIAIAIGIGEAF